MYEVAEHFYQELIPQAREIAHQAEEAGRTVGAEAVQKVIEDLLNRPEHTWYEEMKKTAKKDAEDRAAVVIPADAIVAPADVSLRGLKPASDLRVKTGQGFRREWDYLLVFLLFFSARHGARVWPVLEVAGFESLSPGRALFLSD